MEGKDWIISVLLACFMEKNGTKLIFKSLSQENILEIEKEQNTQN